MGPLVSDEQFKRVASFINSGVQEGAEVVTGGKKGSEDAGYFVQPTVQAGDKGCSRRDFRAGRVRLDDHRRRLRSDRQPGQQHDLRTRGQRPDPRQRRYGLDQLPQRVRRVATFGGYKESGWGREMAEFVLNNYTEVKAVTTAL